MTKLKCGLIQMAFKGDMSMEPDTIRDIMIEAHIPYIEDVAKQGVQVLCFQEVFTQLYFCPSQDQKWFAATEYIPDGHTTRLMQEYAKKHNMVIVVPIYEEQMPGVYYRYQPVPQYASCSAVNVNRLSIVPPVVHGATGVRRTQGMKSPRSSPNNMMTRKFSAM